LLNLVLVFSTNVVEPWQQRCNEQQALCPRFNNVDGKNEDQVQQSLSKISEPTRLPDEQLDDLKNTEGA
jgi:hypothetical protein